MAAPASLVNGAVIVKLPFELDVSGLTAELFGESITLTGSIIDVTAEKILVTKMYDPAGKSWIHYVQDISEDTFVTFIDPSGADSVEAELKRCVRLDEGAEYNLTKRGLAGLDTASAFAPVDANRPFPGQSAPWLQYYSLQDFVLSYLANEIFGHPGALAPIANDSTLRASIATKFAAGVKAVQGEKGLQCSGDVATRELMVAALASDAASARVVPTNALTAAGLNLIVQQVMDQAPGRFTEASKGTIQALEWKENDVIQVQLNLKDNKYKLYTAGTNAAGVTDQNQLFNADTPIKSMTSDSYVLRYSVAA